MRHPGAAGSPGTGGRVSGARILAVDDQLYFRVFLEDLLREEGVGEVIIPKVGESFEL